MSFLDLADDLPGAPTGERGEGLEDVARAHTLEGAGGFRISEQELLRDCVVG